MNAIFPTAYLPPVIYFSALLKFEELKIESNETFPKQTWRNRCSILSSQGVLNLTIPIARPQGNHTKITDIEIDFSQKWQNLHWRAIEAAYNKSPFFLFYHDELKRLIYSEEPSLLAYNHALIAFFIKFFKMPQKISYTNDYQYIEKYSDLRRMISPKIEPFVPLHQFPSYYQVFSDRLSFIPNLSILDLAVNEGTSGISYLKKLASEFSF